MPKLVLIKHSPHEWIKIANVNTDGGPPRLAVLMVEMHIVDLSGLGERSMWQVTIHVRKGQGWELVDAENFFSKQHATESLLSQLDEF